MFSLELGSSEQGLELRPDEFTDGSLLQPFWQWVSEFYL